MICSIILKYEDGHTEEIGSPHGCLGTATKAALELADYLGRHPSPEEDRLPKWVEIYCDAVFLISIQVFKGGLINPERPG